MNNEIYFCEKCDVVKPKDDLIVAGYISDLAAYGELTIYHCKDCDEKGK